MKLSAKTNSTTFASHNYFQSTSGVDSNGHQDGQHTGRLRLLKTLLLTVLMLCGVVLQFALAEPVTTVFDNGPPQNRVDIVFLGDGYTVAERDRFADDVNSTVALFFRQEPFREYRNYFNVHRIDVVSPQSGADHPARGVSVETALDATYNCSGIQRLICVDVSEVNAVVARSVDATMADIVIVLVNDFEYGGSGGAIAVASRNESTVELALHELGHSFGLLADEYSTSPPGCDNAFEPWEVNVTKQTDRDSVKWNFGGGPLQGWIEFSTPVPTFGNRSATPGLYEGAKYCDAGLYRPTYRSKMRELGFPYEQVNEEQLIKRIYNFVSPIDTVNPTDDQPTVARTDRLPFSVDSLTPVTTPLDATWFVNNQFAGSGAIFEFDPSTVSPGTHRIRVDVRDSTERVRHDQNALLGDSHVWVVRVQSSDTADEGDGNTVTGSDNTDDVTSDALILTVESEAFIRADQYLRIDYNVNNTIGREVADVVVTDNLNDEPVCTIGSLSAGFAALCTRVYRTSAADVDAGEIAVVVNANSSDTAGGPLDSPLDRPLGTTVTSIALDSTSDTQVDGLSLSVLPSESSFDSPNSIIVYTYTVTNNAGQPLSGISIVDPLVGGTVCEDFALSPTYSANCSQVYVTSEVDVRRGEVINTATAKSNQTAAVDASARVTLAASSSQSANDNAAGDDNTDRSPDMAADEDSEDEPVTLLGEAKSTGYSRTGEFLVFEFTARNGTSNEIRDISLTDTRTNQPICDIDLLSPGFSAYCTYIVQTTGADVSAGALTFDAAVAYGGTASTQSTTLTVPRTTP